MYIAGAETVQKVERNWGGSKPSPRRAHGFLLRWLVCSRYEPRKPTEQDAGCAEKADEQTRTPLRQYAMGAA